MPRHERYPTPLLNMNPAALPGLGVVALMFLGMWALFGPFFLIGLLLMSVIAVVAALLIRNRRAKHPASKDLAQLDLESRNEGREDQ
jgi:membrane protein implicated in regulation of membrane protease activity